MGSQEGLSKDGPPTVGLGELLAPVRGRLVLAVVLQALGAAAAVVPFVAVAELGRVLLDPAGIDSGRAWTVALLGAGGYLVGLVLSLTAGSITHLADNSLSLDLRRRLADRLGRLPLGWFTDRNSGQVRKSMNEDVAAMHHLVGHTIINLTSLVVTPLVSLGYLLWVDWRLALLTIVPLLVAIGFNLRLAATAKDDFQEYDRSLGRIGAAAVEFVNGISVIKTFGQTGKAHRRFLDAADDFSTFFLGWVRGIFRTAAIVELVCSPVFVLLWVLGGGSVFVAAGWIPAVELLPFVLLGLGLTAPLATMEFAEQEIRTANQAAARVGALLAEPELAEPVEAREPVGTRVEFDAVSYGYDARSTAVDAVSFTLEPGTVTALVGPSGSGKTTLARLLPRFFDVTAGAIRIGGADLRELPADRLYRLVSFVFQDVQLLRASVRDNIALARPDATDDEVHAAARAAQIHDRILALPGGYDAVVGVDARLSGGEAQRVSIARALLADTPVLVLDEATAFADPESEAAIQEALSTLVTGRTLLVIAHRLATIADADQILVLDQGRIAERGRHDDLLAANGGYARSWAAHERTGDWAPHRSPLPATEVAR